nr:hypothetical protein [Staphylococcus caprae]
MEDNLLTVKDCTVKTQNGLFYVRLTGIDNEQGLAVKSPYVIADFLTNYYHLVEDNESLSMSDFE